MKRGLVLSVLLLLLAACTAPIDVSIRDRQGNSVGSAQLIPVAEGTQIELVGFNLPPGQHGLHIHENPLCEAPDFATAGGHYNPEQRQHGFSNPDGHHMGDLPNLEISDEGVGRARIVIPVSFNDIKGRSIVIHADPDDYMTDPSGNSGARIGCGIIA